MDLTNEDVLAILTLVEASNIEYLELDVGGTKLIAAKHGSAPVSREPTSPLLPSTPAPVPLSGGEVVHRAAEVSEDGLVTVTAPVLGVFYRAPEPGGPCYVEVGSHVVAGSTIGLVEVMKMLTNVSSEVSGEVIEILVENDQFVEFGQELIVIRPETPG